MKASAPTVFVLAWGLFPPRHNDHPFTVNLDFSRPLHALSQHRSALLGGTFVNTLRRVFLASLLIVATQQDARAQGVNVGDIVVSDFGSLTSPPRLLIIDPKTGGQSALLSVPGTPAGMAYDRMSNRILLPSYTELQFVDLTTGRLSSLGLFPFNLIDAVAIEAPHRYLLTDYNGMLLRYDEFQFPGTLQVVASGGLIGGVSPWSVQMGKDGQAIVSSFTYYGQDEIGPPARVIKIDPSTGAQTLVYESHDLQFGDFIVQGDQIIIATNSRGTPNGGDGVARLDLNTGVLTPLYSGLQRTVDVDQLADGRLCILDQTLIRDDLIPPVVYKEQGKGLRPLSTSGLLSIPVRSVVIQCMEDKDCRGHGQGQSAICSLQGTCT